MEEYPTFEGIILAARAQGFEITGLSHSDMIAMMKEEGRPASPSIAELYGLRDKQHGPPHATRIERLTCGIEGSPFWPLPSYVERPV